MVKFSSEAIENSLPLLATRYSKKFGVTIRIQGSTAYTNGSTITIPRMDLNDVNKARFTYAYLAHEAAHIKYTNMEFWKERKVKEKTEFETSILNVLEDARVERIISSRYIGVFENLQFLRDYKVDWHNFIQAIKRGEIEENDLLLSYMIEYLAVHCQGFFSETDKYDFLRECLNINYAPEVFSKMNLLLNQVKDCKGIEAAYEISRKIYTLIAKEKEKRKEKDNQQIEENEQTESKKESDDNDFIPSCPGYNFSEKIEGFSSVKNSSSRDDFGALGTQEVQPGRDLTSECREYFKLRTILRKKVKTWCEFQRNSSSQRGRYLNILKAQNIRFGESKVFYSKGEEVDYSTSIHLLVDCSDSMMTSDNGDKSRAELASLSALNLALALDGIDGVKLMVSFFSGYCGEVDSCLDYNERVKKKVCYFDQRPRGSTPLAQAIFHAISKVQEVNCNRNMIILITDGMADSSINAKNAISICDKSGIEVYGIGIHSNFLVSFLDVDKFRVIEDTNELPKVCSKIVAGLFEVSKSDLLSLQ